MHAITTLAGLPARIDAAGVAIVLTAPLAVGDMPAGHREPLEDAAARPAWDELAERLPASGLAPGTVRFGRSVTVAALRRESRDDSEDARIVAALAAPVAALAADAG
ncbi:MAG: hypothetical protein RLW62_03850 [Gammaproteobacteria bacterium]